MALNPNISLAVKGLEVQDPMNAYAKAMQIQSAQNQNALAQYQLSAAQRADEQATARMNALRGAGANPQSIANALLQSGDVKGYTEFLKSNREADKAQVELIDSKLKQSRAFLDTLDPTDPTAPQQYLAWHQANHADPVLGPVLAARGVTAEQSLGRIQQAIQAGPQAFAQLVNQSKLGTEKFMELNKPTTQVIDQSGQRQVIQLPGLGGAPTTVGTYADVPLPAGVEAQKARIGAASAPRMTVQNIQEREESKAYGQRLVKGYDAVAEAAKIASKTLPAIDTNLNILDKGFATGFGTEAKAAGAKVLGALGVEDAAKYATNAQVFQAKAVETVLQKQLEQKGPQTESDAQRIDQIGSQLGKTTEANRFLLTVAKEQLKRDVDQRNFYDKWRESKGTYDGAEAAWSQGEGGKSLFDRPALKKYMSGQPTTAGIPGQGAAPAAPAARTVTRTGTLNGRKVIQYSDGSVEYGN